MFVKNLRFSAYTISTILTLSCLACCVSRAPAQEALAAGARSHAEGLTLYVSTAGDDAWSGRLDEPNTSATDGPLASVGKARDVIRQSKAATGGLTKPVTVMLRGGVYPQTEPIVFTAADSGTKQCPVTYQAYPGEKPVIRGGDVIRSWQADDGQQSQTRCAGKLWRAAVPATKAGDPWRFNQLFVNGQRRTRARVPNKGSFLRTDGPTSKGNARGFYFHEGDVKAWDNPREVIFVVYHSWETSVHHVRRVDTEACLVELHEPAPWPMGQWERQQRYYVENVFEALDQPGEWYLDRATGTLYYYPLAGETMADVEVVAPTLTSTLVRFNGDATSGEIIEYVHFRGVSFSHSNANLSRLRNPGQGEIYQPGLIMATGLRHASFEDCTIAHTGAHGIWLAAGCEDNRIERCHIHDLGGGGVYIGGGWGLHETAPTRRVVVDNNFIHDGSHLFHGAHGVWIGKSSHNRVTHNEISNFDYSGISCGWSWGFQPSSANHNILDYNHIHHLGNGDGLSDMGGIYTLGISPGTTERYNHIHHVYSYAHVSHGSGVYPDEGSSEILIENNVVYRVRTCPLFQHYGKDNIVRNNVFAFGGKAQLQRCREDRPCHYVAEGNIVLAEIEQMLGGVWKNGDWKVGGNVYWSTAGAPEFAGMDFATWKAKGADVGSIVADPLFVDAENDDFRLRPESPALKLGFQPIDLGKTGLYGNQDWIDLPKQTKNRPLHEIPAPIEPPFVVHFDFERDEPGAEPLEGKVVQGGEQAALVVSPETAASGGQSLKFVDAPGQQYGYTPHLYYNPSHATGKVRLSWDMLNSADAPASFYVEVRQWDESPYLVGPTVSVAPDGRVTAGGREVGVIPLGQWAHVDIDIELGPGQPKTYQLTLRVPNREPIVAEVPYVSEAFEKITWFGISSTSNGATVFYLDNLKLGTAEQLAQAPKHRRKTRPVRRRPREPANDQMLMGHWKFDEPEGYVAEDSSGYANDGDVWAAWAKGPFGGALFCDSTSSHVVVPDDPTLQFGTSDFSIELWLCPTMLKIESNDPRRRFMSKDNYPQSWWNLNITTGGKPFLEMVDANKASCANRPTGTVPENAWTHLVVVVDRANAKTRYYFNGKLDSVQDIPAAFTGALDVEGGELSLGSPWQPFVGLLDEVKIYKRGLTADEIRAGYGKEKGNRTNAAYELVE
ncbi:MAG: right-handed parallel beta-helix repeat-containing protein [Planctomycetes bacterium]|nr:right-handed parallel beta-helix repeat-containing protein [Planctomycetota bacterium]